MKNKILNNQVKNKSYVLGNYNIFKDYQSKERYQIILFHKKSGKVESENRKIITHQEALSLLDDKNCVNRELMRNLIESLNKPKKSNIMKNSKSVFELSLGLSIILLAILLISHFYYFSGIIPFKEEMTWHQLALIFLTGTFIIDSLEKWTNLKFSKKENQAVLKMYIPVAIILMVVSYLPENNMILAGITCTGVIIVSAIAEIVWSIKNSKK